MTATSIEWTDVSWNVLRGCSRVSAGCENCYAEQVAPEDVYREIVGPTKVWLVLDHCHDSGVIGAHASPESARREMETYTAPPLLKREASIEEHEVLP